MANLTGKPATCLLGGLLGHDLDERRANRLDDGRVLCVICTMNGYHGVDGPSTFDALVHLGQDTPDWYTAAGALEEHRSSAPLQAYDFHFNVGSGIAATLRFDTPDVFKLKPDAEIGRDYNRSEFGKVPAAVDKAVRLLTESGYRVLGGGQRDTSLEGLSGEALLQARSNGGRPSGGSIRLARGQFLLREKGLLTAAVVSFEWLD